MAEKFLVLSDAAHIAMRPSMYIGSTAAEEVEMFHEMQWNKLTIVPGLIKIVSEIIDNSIDEYIRTQGKFAYDIIIDIKQTIDGLMVKVTDNGRGIPVVQHDGVWQPELSWLRARAGTSFTDDRTSIGANGIGSFATCVFSESFQGESRDGSRRCRVFASKGEKTKDTQVSKNTGPTGCTITFIPDLEQFNGGDINPYHLISYFMIRLTHVVRTFGGKLQFTLNGHVIRQEATKKAQHEAFHPDAVWSDGKYGKIAVAPSLEAAKTTYINGLFCMNGGTHVNSIGNQLAGLLGEMIKKKHKIEVNKAQILGGLHIGSWLHGVKNLKFDSQSKDRITNSASEVNEILSGHDMTKFASAIMSKPEIITPIIASALRAKESADAAALLKAQKAKRQQIIIDHIDCSSSVVKDRVLFITEGDSAIGPLMEVRDARYHAGYALQGKPLNVHGRKWVDIMKNKEMSDLMHIIGLKPDGSIDPMYGKIVIMSDADTDGDAICCLMINFLARWPELFSRGLVYRVQPPLFILRSGKGQKYLYTEDEANKAKGAYKYIKGLGTMETADYREMIRNPRLVRIELDSTEMLDVAFGDSAERRKEWLLGDNA